MSSRDSVVVVAGVGDEIGEASALRFSEAGWSVACVDAAAAAARRAAERIAALGGRAVAVTADVSTADGNRRLLDETVAALGGVDALLANPGMPTSRALGEMTLAQWDRLHATALRGVYLTIKHVIPELRKRGGGSIVITAPQLGVVSDGQATAYAAVKGALRSLCRSVATGYGRDNIRVNTICPGDVETQALVEALAADGTDPQTALEEIIRRYPLGRLASPRDLANVAVFLASPEAGYLSGTDVVVDGGLLAQIS